MQEAILIETLPDQVAERKDNLRENLLVLIEIIKDALLQEDDKPLVSLETLQTAVRRAFDIKLLLRKKGEHTNSEGI